MSTRKITLTELKNLVKEVLSEDEEKTPVKEYTFGFIYWTPSMEPNSDPDYEYETISVKASGEDEAREMAYQEARQEYRVYSSKDKFELVKTRELSDGESL